MGQGSALISRGTKLVGGLEFLNGGSIKSIESATVSVNPTSLASVTTLSLDVTVTGIAVGDFLSVQRPAALEDDLLFCGARIKAADTVTIFLYNPTASPIDGAALNWVFDWIDLT